MERILIFFDSGVITADDIYFDEDTEISAESRGNLSEVLEDTEYRMIKNALDKSGGVKQKAARMLGIKTSTLYYKLEKYGLYAGGNNPEDTRGDELEDTNTL